MLIGHHFNGNLRAFFEHAVASNSDIECKFVYIDHREYRRRRGESPCLLSAARPDHMVWACGADVIVADRGLGVFRILDRLRIDLRTVQVWHGVGYKGFTGAQLATYRGFTAIFAASEHDRSQWHAGGEGPETERIHVTGYARTDPLVRQDHDPVAVSRRLELDDAVQARVLLAPTWQQDEAGRSIVPFGLSREQFFGRLETWGRDHDVELVFRAHLNTDFVPSGGYRRVVFRGLQDHPITEDLLLLSDVLVSDWSSITTDFLVLGRPVVYLDVPPPFAHGFGNLDDRDRPGYIARSFDEMLTAMSRGVRDPSDYERRFRTDRDRVLDKAFGGTLDGRCSRRYLEAVRAIAGGAETP